ncbi:hypothetical protein [Endozoicomonas sp.]|uniref:hypothetical protein n=1 Tax=Endozoicomonas sp. TaxID=1892382 RepID=UPI002888AEF8|nr:hypothetical protein [Endozoicomonas sp.]
MQNMQNMQNMQKMQNIPLSSTPLRLEEGTPQSQKRSGSYVSVGSKDSQKGEEPHRGPCHRFKHFVLTHKAVSTGVGIIVAGALIGGYAGIAAAVGSVASVALTNRNITLAPSATPNSTTFPNPVTTAIPASYQFADCNDAGLNLTCVKNFSADNDQKVVQVDIPFVDAETNAPAVSDSFLAKTLIDKNAFTYWILKDETTNRSATLSFNGHQRVGSIDIAFYEGIYMSETTEIGYRNCCDEWQSLGNFSIDSSSFTQSKFRTIQTQSISFNEIITNKIRLTFGRSLKNPFIKNLRKGHIGITGVSATGLGNITNTPAWISESSQHCMEESSGCRPFSLLWDQDQEALTNKTAFQYCEERGGNVRYRSSSERT